MNALVNNMDPHPEPDLNAALNQLWLRFRSNLIERVSTLESAAAAFADQKLSREQQEAAFAAAHNLAGVLGTFAMEHGTVLAHQLEMLFGFARRPNRQLAERLCSISAELRALIESR